MSTISNEREFKQALGYLSPSEERLVSALFLQNVLDVTDDTRIKKAVKVALDGHATVQEQTDAYNIARSIATETFTVVGHALDPERQALHFLATATSYCLFPEHLRPHYCKKRASWAIALHTRMARCWSQVARGQEEEELREDEDQYKILGSFLAGR